MSTLNPKSQMKALGVLLEKIDEKHVSDKSEVA